MGSFAELRLGPFILGTSKGGVDPRIMRLFRQTDKQLVPTAEIWPEECDYTLEDMLNGDTPNLKYSCTVAIAKDRLDLMGFTKEVAEAGFYQGLNEEIDRLTNIGLPDVVKGLFEERLTILRSLKVSQWLSGCDYIRNMLTNGGSQFTQQKYFHPPLIKYMLESDEWYGFPGNEHNHFLRILLDACSPNEELIYDLSDLVVGGYIEEFDDLIDYSDEIISSDFIRSTRYIVLTEGISDRWILERSLKLLYPHLADYYKFLDFTEMKVEGGAGALVNTIKAFSGAGIINRIIALFDNDTAAASALLSIQNINLPDNIVILKYPYLEIAEEYPTLGPTGINRMNINGLAGSIELYLGADILEDDTGRLTPVQWRGYEPKICQYQGELLYKNLIHKRFRDKLEICETYPEKIVEYDWSGIHAIINLMRTAFHTQFA